MVYVCAWRVVWTICFLALFLGRARGLRVSVSINQLLTNQMGVAQNTFGHP